MTQVHEDERMLQVMSPAGYRFMGLGDLASLAIAFYMQQLM
jgi:hypothetical protein